MPYDFDLCGLVDASYAIVNSTLGISSVRDRKYRGFKRDESLLEKVRDHTFAQLTAMVADVRGSMMKPTTGEPTRNFLAGEIYAEHLKSSHRCPNNLDELYKLCQKQIVKTVNICHLILNLRR